jgi:uncharacterized membrane protein YgcG
MNTKYLKAILILLLCVDNTFQGATATGTVTQSLLVSRLLHNANVQTISPRRLILVRPTACHTATVLRPVTLVRRTTATNAGFVPFQNINVNSSVNPCISSTSTASGRTININIAGGPGGAGGDGGAATGANSTGGAGGGGGAGGDANLTIIKNNSGTITTGSTA